MYWRALTSLGRGQAIPLPEPHPKFTLSDIERIAREGPRFSDLVLEHVERLDGVEGVPGADAQTAVAYSYIPTTVLGDWGLEVEPRWAELTQVRGMRRRGEG